MLRTCQRKARQICLDDVTTLHYSNWLLVSSSRTDYFYAKRLKIHSKEMINFVKENSISWQSLTKIALDLDLIKSTVAFMAKTIRVLNMNL